MARRNGDWAPCQNYGELVRFTTTTMGGILLLRHGITSEDPGLEPLAHPAVAVMEMTDTIVSHRTVGQLDWRFNNAVTPNSIYLVNLRIVKCIYDEDDNEFLAFEDDLATADDANSQFLWERRFVLQEGLNDGSIGLNPLLHDPAWTSVDVAVNRKLEREEALMLLVQVDTTAATGWTLDIIPYLRTWATRP